MRVARLLFPAIRWDRDHGWEPARQGIDDALVLGVGGFCLFGGEADAVADLTAELRSRSRSPLLIASDLERGAGQQFAGATQLPPLAAIGALDDVAATRAAANLTAREARALGVNWIFAPVADVDLEADNPIVGTRSFGNDPALVAKHVAEWIAGCHDAGALCCAKHFPGHGRTVEDSHAALPLVEANRDELEADLMPFRAAIAADVDAMMTAHVAYLALDATAAPATLSPAIVTGLLRRSLDFGGLIVTDALIMAGVLGGGLTESRATVHAIAAGCDALLYPQDVAGVARAVEAAVGTDIPENRVLEAIGRIDTAAARAADAEGESGGGAWGGPEDREWALELGQRTLIALAGAPRVPRSVDLLTIDDDLGGPYPPPSRAAFAEALRAANVDVREASSAHGERDLLVAVYSDIRAWKGRPGLSGAAKQSVADALAAQPAATIVLFGHPRLGTDLRAGQVLAAWGGERIMQQAAARWLVAGGPPR
jgi:beta-glucosidase-like glycosyl hydrolase